MNNKYFYQNVFMVIIVLYCTSCSYIQHYQQQAHYSKIKNELSVSTLKQVNEYTSRTPFHKTYEFEFSTTENKSFALIFYISESSFSNSILKHRNADALHRDAVRIDDSKKLLTALNKNLPNINNIAWTQVTNQIKHNEARDSYHVMQSYIRLKIRDL